MRERKLSITTKTFIMDYPAVVHLEAVVMENGEVIHYGKSLGFINQRQRDLLEKGAHKTARGGEAMVAVGEEVA